MTRRKHDFDVVSFATAFADQSDETDEPTELVIPEELSSLDAEALDSLHNRAVETFTGIYGDGKGLNPSDMETLEGLTEGIKALRAEKDKRDSEAAEVAQKAAALAAEVVTSEDDEDDDAEASEELASEDESSEDDSEDSDEDDSAEAEETLARKEVRVNLSSLRARKPKTPAPAEPTGPQTLKDVAMAAADVPGLANGQPVDFGDMASATVRRLQSFNVKQFENASKGNRRLRQQFGLAVFNKPFEDGLIVDDKKGNTEDVLRYAVDDSRLPGGSLLASGGWCAPSETLYDLYDCGESRDGMVSVPEIGIRRGGLRWPRPTSFASVYADTGFHYTEAEDESGAEYPKPCYKIPCIEFEEERLELEGLCIEAGLLQRRGYPEQIEDVIRKAMIAHDHKMDVFVVNALVAGSTEVDMPADQVGAVAPLLTAIELQVAHYRASNRLAMNTTLEAIFPFWVHGVIRSDLSRRLGVAEFDVSDERINGWFRQRGISPQFIYNWQSIASTAASGFTSWPTTASFLLYRAGTWFRGGADVITLDTLYDSTLLANNDYTALFTEEGILVGMRGCDSRKVDVPICPDGSTAIGVAIDCDGSAG